MGGVTVTPDPSQQIDPNQTNDAVQKKAEQIIQQLGLHPSQAAARSALGLGMSTPPSSVSVPPTAPPLIKMAAGASATPPNPGEAAAISNVPKASNLINSPQINPAAQASTTSPVKIASPIRSAPLISSPSQTNSQNATTTAQNELARMEKTGPGVDQIKNPFLRILGKAGNIAESILMPEAAVYTPGTTLHHDLLEKQQGKLINSSLANQATEATAAHTNEQTQALKDAIPKNDFALWMQQHPGEDVGDYWKSKATDKKTAVPTMAMQTFDHYLNDQHLPFEEAVKKTQALLASAKPETKETDTLHAQALLQKAFPDGNIPEAIMTSLPALTKAIESSPNLSDDEKGELMTHFVFNPSPAETGTTAAVRGSSYGSAREYPVISTETGNLQLRSATDINANPDHFVPATQGQTSMTKESIFHDIHFNADQTRTALEGLKTDFTPTQRAQFAYVLRSNDTHSSLDAFLNGQTGKTLTPDQVDYVTALASLQENALAMRSIAGMGQGSDELRAAILKTLPGTNTPNKAYAERQMDLFDGTVSRLEQGVPHSGVKQPKLAPVPNTAASHNNPDDHPPTTGNKAPEGTIIQTAKGKQIKQDGKWVDYNGH